MQRIYLDHAASTPMDDKVIEAMLPYMKNEFGNPSSIHSYGRATKAALEQARKSVAACIGASTGEIYFTSGGTEANNLALQRAVDDYKIKTIITSPIEHHAVLRTVNYLEESRGVQKSYLSLDEKGHIDLEEFENLLQKNDNVLVSLMHANNEIGTLHPLEKIIELCRQNNALIHSDTVQTVGHFNVNVQELKPDLITCSAHKIHGPKGVGFLYVNSRLNLTPLIHGGGHEKGLRSGTENIYGIVGLSKALELAVDNIEEQHKYVRGLKEKSMRTLTSAIPGVEFHGDTSDEKSLYTILNISFPEIEQSDMFLFNLDLKGLAVSGGSACGSGAKAGSHVLQNINANMGRPNVRLSFSCHTTQEEIESAIDIIVKTFENS